MALFQQQQPTSMTLFGHVMTGHGNSAHAVHQLGIEGVARKGGAGRAPEHAAPSKAAAIRTIEDGFGVKHGNVDLILRRTSRPDEATTVARRSSHAGGLSPDRRRVDMPPVLRQRSLDHLVERRHTAPPPRMEVTRNAVICSARCQNSADRIGRNVRGRSRSPSEDTPRSPKPRDFGLRKSPPRPTARSAKLLPVFVQPPPDAAVSGHKDDTCSWGADHAFEESPAPTEDTSSCGDSTPARSAVAPPVEPGAAASPCQPGEALIWQVAEALKKREGGRDDLYSTLSTVAGTPLSARSGVFSPSSGGFSPSTSTPRLPFKRESSVTSLRGEGQRQSSIMNFARTIDKRFARNHEQRIQSMVKAEQRAALKRVFK